MKEKRVKKLIKKILCYKVGGSLTLEAAVVLPLYMYALVAIISLMEMIKCYEDVEINLYRAGKEIALYSVGKEIIPMASEGIIDDIGSTVVSDLYAENLMKEQLINNYQSDNMIIGSAEGVSLIQSKVTNDLVDLVADYKMEPLCNIFGIASYEMVNRARLHAWTGYEGNESNLDKSGERLVYVTETGSAYHLTRTCTHILLSINPINSSELMMQRNTDGSKYKPCEKCCNNFSGESETLYITDDGDKYHTSLNCSGLKRTVSVIPISEVGERSQCQRCGM